MGHPTDSQIFRAIKEGVKEIIESMKEHNREQLKKLEEIERKIKDGNG